MGKMDKLLTTDDEEAIYKLYYKFFSVAMPKPNSHSFKCHFDSDKSQGANPLVLKEDKFSIPVREAGKDGQLQPVFTGLETSANGL